MATLTNPILKISPAANLTTRSPHPQGRSHIRFLRCWSPRPIKLQSSSLSVPNVKALEDLEAVASTEMHITQIPTTVHMRFQLQKECSFGEQFLLVGDDPILGSWNPTSAIPLNWSEGHIWTVEMDLPVDLPIQFKFLHKDWKGEIQWQPGPDRDLRTWEVKNTLVITEDWEDAEMQKITEEQMMMSGVTLVSSNIEQNHNFTTASVMASTNMETSTSGGPVLVSGLSPLQVVSSAEEPVPWECGNVVADQNSMGFSAEE